MKRKKLVDDSRGKFKGGKNVISGRMAMRYLNLSDRVFFPALKNKTLVAQMYWKRAGRIEYHFAIEYLNAVAKILPRGRKKGKEVFTEEIRQKLSSLNKEWDNRKNINWEKDSAETDKIMKRLESKK